MVATGECSLSVLAGQHRFHFRPDAVDVGVLDLTLPVHRRGVAKASVSIFIKRACRQNCGLSKIPRFHLDAVDVQIGNVDVARPQALRRQTARIQSGTAMMEFVAASVR
jgi:hypothetical protein